MKGKILAAALTAMMLLVFAVPAFAQCGACGGFGYGAGIGACGAAAYGPPQDCVATVSCNVPVTQNVPYITSTTVSQPVQVPVTVPVQSSVTIPTAVIVPQEVPITTYATSCVTQDVPVQVPVTAYQPMTSYVPQTYTVPLGSCPASGTMMGANAPAGSLSKMSANTYTGMAKGDFSK